MPGSNARGEERKRLTRRYRAIVAAVTEILYRHDPVSIGEEGNEDEYELEAGIIVPRLRGAASAEDVEPIVREVLTHTLNFDDPSLDGRGICAAIAGDIWHELASSDASPST